MSELNTDDSIEEKSPGEEEVINEISEEKSPGEELISELNTDDSIEETPRVKKTGTSRAKIKAIHPPVTELTYFEYIQQLRADKANGVRLAPVDR